MRDGVQIDMQLAAHARERQLSNPAQVGRTAAQELGDPVGAAEVQVRVVFPGDTDAAEDLNAIFGVGLGGLDSRTGGDRRRDRQLGVGGVGGDDRRGRCRVGGRYRDLLGAQKHLRTHVLDGLKAADRLAELLANLGVFGSRLQSPPRNSGGLGSHQGRRKIGKPPTRYGQSGRWRGVQRDPGQRPGKIGGRQGFHGHAVSTGVEGHHVIADRQQQQAGNRSAQDVLSRSGHPAGLLAKVGGQGRTRSQLPGRQRLEDGGIGDHQ